MSYRPLLLVILLLVMVGFLTWLSLVTDSSEGKMYAVILLFVGLLSSAIIIIALIRDHRLIKRASKEEKLEGISEGYVEESTIFRELTEAEKVILQGKRRLPLKVIKYGSALILFFLIFDLFFLFYPFSLGLLGYLLFSSQFVLILIALRERSIYLDLRSPVFKVQGKIFPQESDGSYSFKVKGLKFNLSMNSELGSTYAKFNSFEEVIVEYSPRTRHVWRICKTEDI